MEAVKQNKIYILYINKCVFFPFEQINSTHNSEFSFAKISDLRTDSTEFEERERERTYVMSARLHLLLIWTGSNHPSD